MASTHVLDQLVVLLTDIHSQGEMKAFLKAFLSESEQAVFAKRLTILQLLNQGRSYEEISKDLKVSSATISGIATIKDLPITQRALQLLKREQRLNRLLGL